MTTAPYVPIECGFHDRLEDAAVRRVPVALTLALADGEQVVTARVLDVWAEGGADWVEVEGVGRVRADQVLALNGIQRAGANPCLPPTAR